MSSPLDRIRVKEEADERVRERHRQLQAKRAAQQQWILELDHEIERVEQEVRFREWVDWGDLNRSEPFSPEWGFERGDAVDRRYIKQFLDAHRGEVRGRVLEVCDRGYTSTYGDGQVTHSDVLDIDPTNPLATIVDDLRTGHHLPSDHYDCLILTQVIHLIYEVHAVLVTCHRALKPGGVLLATVPCLSRIDPVSGRDDDYWRFAPGVLRRTVGRVFGAEQVQVESHGNRVVCAAFLLGLADREVTAGELAQHDPDCPLLLSVHARKLPAAG
jgi:SAM-dependent methyltransferase